MRREIRLLVFRGFLLTNASIALMYILSLTDAGEMFRQALTNIPYLFVLMNVFLLAWRHIEDTLGHTEDDFLGDARSLTAERELLTWITRLSEPARSLGLEMLPDYSLRALRTIGTQGFYHLRSDGKKKKIGSHQQGVVNSILW